jgi:serine/threonine-protein kinase
MNGDQPPGTGSATLSLQKCVNEVCNRFEEAWRAGREPHIEEYLAGAPEADRVALLRELLALEIDLRGEAGDRPTPEQYKQRFPDAGDLIEAVFAEAANQPGDSEGARSRCVRSSNARKTLNGASSLSLLTCYAERLSGSKGA